MRVDQEFLLKPSLILDEYNVFSEFLYKKLGRKIIKDIANDCSPSI